jgi:hypothetical protein
MGEIQNKLFSKRRKMIKQKTQQVHDKFHQTNSQRLNADDINIAGEDIGTTQKNIQKLY